MPDLEKIHCKKCFNDKNPQTKTRNIPQQYKNKYGNYTKVITLRFDNISNNILNKQN